MSISVRLGLSLFAESVDYWLQVMRGVSDSLPILRDDAQPIGLVALKEILWNFWR